MTKAFNITKTLLFTFTALMLCACDEEMDHVNSPDDMTISETNIRCNYRPNEYSVSLKTEDAWILDSIFTNTAPEQGEWIRTDIAEGDGPATVNITCDENTGCMTRKASVRFAIKGIYPEYRAVTFLQTGKPETKINDLKDISGESITMSGTYSYHGREEIVTRAGFSVTITDKDGTTETKIVYAETIDEKNFTCVFPVEMDKDYEIKAVTEDADGNQFFSEDSKKISIQFSFGDLSLEGDIRSNCNLKEAKLVLPYYFGNGQTYDISAECDMEGITIPELSVVMSPDGGLIELPITGMTTREGTATFTIKGLPSFVTKAYSISIEVLKGGRHQMIFWESFGEGYIFEGEKAYNIGPKSIEDMTPITDDIIKFRREGQPDVEYMKEGFVTFRISQDGMSNHENPSGSVWLNIKGGKQGKYYVSHLNSMEAKNLVIEVAIKNSSNPENTLFYYSIRENPEDWRALAWAMPEGEHEGSFIITIAGLPESKDFNIKIDMNANAGGAICLDDLRIYGDYE